MTKWTPAIAYDTRMVGSLAAALALSLLAAPLAAQDAPSLDGRPDLDAMLADDQPTGAELVALFRDRCAAIAADPRAAVNATLDGDDASGAITPDGAIAQITEAAFLPGGRQATLFFSQSVLAGGITQLCGLTLFLQDDGALPDLAPLLDAEAPALLGGPATRRGGPVMAGGLANPEPGQLLSWTAGAGFPPDASLSLTQDSRVLTVTLSRALPTAPAP